MRGALGGGEYRCESCGDSFNIEEGGTGWYADLGGPLCWRCEDDEYPPYPCPDDPDGVHHVGCGCEW